MPWSPYMLGVFDEGRIHETAILQKLSSVGISTSESQSRVFDAESNISGRIDARWMDAVNSQPYIVEIKSMSPAVFDKTHGLDDMIHSRFHWVKHYPAQMQVYLHLDRKQNGIYSKGLFLLKNKVNGVLREIEMGYNEEDGEDLMTRGKGIEAHLSAGTLPDRISVAEGLCEDCSFRHVCMPDLAFGEGVELLHDDELLDVLRSRHALLDAVQEYRRLDEMAKRSLKGRAMVVVGDFVSESKSVYRQGFTVAGHTEWRTKIRKLGEDGSSDS